MKTATLRQSPSALRDLQRDWEGWSSWERHAVRALAISSMLFGVFWLALSFSLVH